MNIRRFIRQQVRRSLVQEGGTLQAEHKPDVLGLFEGIIDVGQEFTYLIQLIYELSDNDAYIVNRLNEIVDKYVKIGDVEHFVEKIKKLEEEIRENY